MATATPAPRAAGGRGNARIGRCTTGRDGARRRAGGGARGRRDHAGGRGGVRAPGPVHRRHGAGRPRSGADARRGAGDPAGADAVPGGDRNHGVHQPGRPRPRADPAAAARRGRRGISGLPPGGLRGRAVPHARAGRRDRPAPLPELARRYGRVVADAGTCGCHVHVGVPSREAGVQVLARLRPWLAPLLAVSANSPIAGGHNTGWASWRYPIQSRWPTATPPEAWPDAAAYDTAVRRLIARGAALDERSVYFLAGFPRATRPSRSGWPTSAWTPAPRCWRPG